MRVLILLAILVTSACAPMTGADPVGGFTEAQRPEAPAKIDWQAAQTAEQCATIGGNWRPICMMGKPACVVTYKDAGKACSDSSDCSGSCRTSGAQPGVEARGQCTTNSDPCGCFQLVENGKAGYPLCAD